MLHYDSRRSPSSILEVYILCSLVAGLVLLLLTLTPCLELHLNFKYLNQSHCTAQAWGLVY